MTQASVVPYATGICNTSVCAAIDLAPEEVEREVNAIHPTGISSQWRISGDTFRTGQPNPCPCGTDPESRRHWLLEC